MSPILDKVVTLRSSEFQLYALGEILSSPSKDFHDLLDRIVEAGDEDVTARCMLAMADLKLQVQKLSGMADENHLAISDALYALQASIT